MMPTFSEINAAALADGMLPDYFQTQNRMRWAYLRSGPVQCRRWYK